MPTVVLDAYAKAFPAITNRIRASVYNENDLLAIVASIIDITAGHPSRIYHFPGLPRANYKFSLDEIDGGGIPINNLAIFDVVPGQIDGYLTRNDEQIKVDITPGFDAGLSSVIFDGTGGKPDYIGWIIVPSELTGRGILAVGLDYTWNSLTGEMIWIQPGDILAHDQIYNIHFNPIQNPSGGGVPTINDFDTRYVTESENIEVEDFGNNIICEPAGVYIELLLPDITTVPQGRPVCIETIMALGSAVQCVRILPSGADVINFLRGNIFMMNNEGLEIYKAMRPDDSFEWRVRRPDGNFKTVGSSVGEDAIQSGVYCKQLPDGSIKDKFQYARIYEEYVLNLPATQRCNYDDWATGNNKYLFSLANSADIGNADKFHFPDRRGLFERSNSAGKAGDFITDKIKKFWGGADATINILKVDGLNTEIGTDSIGPGSPNIRFGVLVDQTLFGTETFPKHLLTNKYILI